VPIYNIMFKIIMKGGGAGLGQRGSCVLCKFIYCYEVGWGIEYVFYLSSFIAI